MRNGEEEEKVERQSRSNGSAPVRERSESLDRISGAFRLLSDKEAAKYIGVSKSLLREFVRKGILDRVLLPNPSGYGYINRMLIDVHDLDAFIDQCKGKTHG